MLQKNYPLHGSKMNVCVCARAHTLTHTNIHLTSVKWVIFFATCPLGLQSCSQLSSVFRIYLVNIFAPKAGKTANSKA